VWDIQFADLAEKIITARRAWIKKINQNLSTEYNKIAGGQEKVDIVYHPIHQTKQQIITELSREFSAALPFTGVGPQKHDIHFKLRGRDAKLTASRGENRSIIQAIKSIERQLYFDGDPLVLLDDVLSEFDDRHQQNLLCDSKGEQAIITSANQSTSITDKLVQINIRLNQS
jgi:DNA replication and repair protein RecF